MDKTNKGYIMRTALLTLLTGFLLTSSLAFAGTTTTNYSLYKPAANETGWGDSVNTNMDTIDTQMKTTADAAALNTTHRTSNGSDHSFIDQDVTSGSTPTFTGTNITGIDISAGTNLAVSGTLLDLTGDTLSINEGTLTDTKVCTYESGTGIECNTTNASGAFSDASDPIVQNTTTKDVHVGDGAGTLSGKLEIGGDADQPQLVVEGHSTQTDSLAVFQNDADTEVFTIDVTGLASTLVGIDGIGAVDLDYGSVDITDHTFVTDGTGTGEVVLPAQSIDSTEILDATILNADINASAAIAISKTALVAGTNITLATDTLNVDDAFLINDGDDTTSGTITAAGYVGNLYDASGAVDLDIGSGDVTDVTITTDGGAVIIDGTITQDAGTTLFMGGLLDATGAVDMDYGSGDITDHTFTTDSTGDAEIVLPNDSIGPAELDSTTGAYDFGAVTSLEIPNGAAPTVDAAGETAVDTTGDDLIYYGGAKRNITYKHTLKKTLESPADADSFLIYKAPYALTITDIECIVDPADTSESVVIDIQECGSTGDSCTTVDATITCDNDGASDDGTLTNGAIDSGDWINWDIGTVTGTVTQVSVTITHYKNAE